MFILQNGKLHIQKDKGIIGVDIDSNGVHEVKGTVDKMTVYRILSPFEVSCKFQITDSNPYIFPRPKKDIVVKEEVKKNDSTTKTKKPTGKSK